MYGKIPNGLGYSKVILLIGMVEVVVARLRWKSSIIFLVVLQYCSIIRIGSKNHLRCAVGRLKT